MLRCGLGAPHAGQNPPQRDVLRSGGLHIPGRPPWSPLAATEPPCEDRRRAAVTGGGGGETEGLRCGLRGVAGVHWPAVLARSGRRARCGEGAPPWVRGPARKDTPTGRCAHHPPRACGGASRWPRRGPRRTSRSGASARVGAIARASSVDGGRAVPDNTVQRRCLSWSGQHDVMGRHPVTLYGLHPVRPNGRIASVAPAPGACSPHSHSL